MNADELAAQLRADLCASFVVRPAGEDRWSIRTPMLFGDGDSFPVFVERSASGWVLTDEGLSVSHLFFDDFRYTDARFNRIVMLIEAHEARLDPNHVIRLPMDGFPDAFDVGDYLQLVSQVQGVALTLETERDQQHFVTAVRDRIVQRLMTPGFESNWSPPGLDQATKGRYRCDLRIPTAAAKDVLLFAASTDDKANVSALSVHQFRKHATGILPILAYHPERVHSAAVYRFQDEMAEEGAVVEVFPDSTTALEKALVQHGVDLSAG